jgi:hypothetical protein
MHVFGFYGVGYHTGMHCNAKRGFFSIRKQGAAFKLKDSLYFVFAVKSSVLLIERLNLGVLGVSWSGFGERMSCLSVQSESL